MPAIKIIIAGMARSYKFFMVETGVVIEKLGRIQLK